MSEECEIVETVEKKSPSAGPPLKKLKQSRLPFTPVNTKSPQQTDTPKSEKKRKLSGDNDSPNSAKTPRNENERADGKVADENRLTPAEKGATKDVVPKRGRPVGWTKKASSSKLNDSSQKERHAEEDDQSNASREKKDNDNKKKNTAKVEKSGSNDRQIVCGETDRPDPSAVEKEKDDEVDGDLETSQCSTRQDAEDPESSSEEEGDEDSTKDADTSQQGEGKAARKRGRPRTKTPTPHDESKPKRSKGRPRGSKNIPRSVSNSDLNKSTSGCSNSKDDDTIGQNLTSTPKGTEKKMSPMVKTRTLLSLFAAKGAAKTAEKSRDSPSPVRKVDGGRVDEKRDGGDEKLKSEKLVKNKEEEDEIKEIRDNCKEESKKGEERILFPLDEVTDKSDENPSKDGDTRKPDENEENVDQRIEGKDKKEQSVKNLKDRESEKKDNSDGSEAKAACKTTANLDGSVGEIDASACDSEPNSSLATSPTTPRDVSSDANNSTSSAKEQTPSSSSAKSRLFVKPKSLTPKQKEREAAKLLREEEREKKKQEKDKQLQEKMAEKERLKKQKEEEKRQKEEEKRQKEEEKQKQKEEKEKQREEQRKKKQEEIDAKKLKKDEEQQKKEEKQKKEEEKQKMEEEKRKQSDVLKKKFASFFVAKKREMDESFGETEGPFQQFQVKEDMQLAPLVRLNLSEDQCAELDQYVSGVGDDVSKTYLEILKSQTYIPRKSQRTFPREEKKKEDDDDDDDVEIIEEKEEEEEDEEREDTSDVVCDPAMVLSKNKTHKAKLLSFCENRRPAYWGTWSKKSSTISARRPLAKDVIFDYEYDSDDDWEEEEAGESLSDSEGDDKEEKEEEDQYEVDNDFFVPHGYLSDDEGKSDQEEEEEEDVKKDVKKKAKDKDMEERTERTKTTEQLKLKQAEFEEEMKKKTKELKPRVIGCLWLADENNNPAYKQLMKILSPHRGVTLCSQLPIATSYSNRNTPQEGGIEEGNSKKFAKTFPEEAVPALIKLMHGNCHGKPKLCREFCDYWRKLTGGELEESMINSTPKATPTSSSVRIAKRKVDSKIQEIGAWKRQLDSSTNRYIMCWYVPQHTREKYGYKNLDLPNAWIYINKPQKKKEQDAAETDSPKVGKLRPITAFTKKIPSTPTSANSSPVSSSNTTPQRELPPKTEGLSESEYKTPALSSRTAVGFTTPSATPSTTLRATQDAPNSGRSASSSSSKKKVNLFPAKSPKSGGGPKKGSIVSFLKKTRDSDTSPGRKDPAKDSAKKTEPSKVNEVIVLD